jgi:cobalt/nickel transport system ATP-binding protein
VAELILEARGLSFAYPGGVPALDGLDLPVRRGRRLAVLGPNGAGKSTLLLHLNGTLRPQAGRVLLDGSEAGYARADLTRWRRRVGLVLQEPDDQLFAATVAEDVSFGPLNLGLGEAEARDRVDEALAALGIGDLAGRATHMLSFGQKKRVAIAGALAMRPEVLLLDEPLAGLDRQGARRLLDALGRLAAAGTTLVFSTHDVDMTWDFADDVALFDSGRVVRFGPAAEVLADRPALERAGLEPPLLLDLGVRTREEALALKR